MPLSRPAGTGSLRESGRGTGLPADRRLAPRVAMTTLALTLALTSATSTPRAQTPQGPAAAPATIVVGDSLGVGMRPYLDGLLPDRAVIWDVRSGEGTAWGLGVLRNRLRTVVPGSVVVSLGSNDGPDPRRFESRIRRVLAAVPAPACVIWPSIVRPSRKGDAVGLNRVLIDLSERDHRLVIVDWERAVASGRVRMPDGLHPDPAGYAERSRMAAEAVRAGCPRPVGGVLAPHELAADDQYSRTRSQPVTESPFAFFTVS